MQEAVIQQCPNIIDGEPLPSVIVAGDVSTRVNPLKVKLCGVYNRMCILRGLGMWCKVHKNQ